MRRWMRFTALAVVLLVVAVVRITHRGEEAGGEPVAAPTSAVSATATASPTVTPSPSARPVPAEVDSGPHEDMDPTAAAEGWVAAWLDTGDPKVPVAERKAAWLARLKPITAPELYAGLALTDISRVPHAKVRPGTGVQPVEGRADVSAVVPTTAGGVLVTMTVLNERLIVTSNDWAPGAQGARA